MGWDESLDDLRAMGMVRGQLAAETTVKDTEREGFQQLAETYYYLKVSASICYRFRLTSLMTCASCAGCPGPLG